MTSDPAYCYPDTEVLRNKFGITDFVALDRLERRLVLERYTEGTPSGRFDLKHLRAIHRHLFQDIYDWAGDIRSVEISKGGDQFMFCAISKTVWPTSTAGLSMTIFSKG